MWGGEPQSWQVWACSPSPPPRHGWDELVSGQLRGWFCLRQKRTQTIEREVGRPWAVFGGQGPRCG